MRKTLLGAAAATLLAALLYATFALVESSAGLGLLGSVILEEGGKFLLLAVLASAAARRDGRTAIGPALCFGLATIAVFAAIENLAYFLAFPSSDILARLLWSEPVHLVAGLAEAFAASALADLPGLIRRSGRRDGRAIAENLATIALAAAFAPGWHFGFNLIADKAPTALFESGSPTFLALVLAVGMNATAFFMLLRYFTQRVFVGGYLHGSS